MLWKLKEKSMSDFIVPENCEEIELLFKYNYTGIIIWSKIGKIDILNIMGTVICSHEKVYSFFIIKGSLNHFDWRILG
jgi:hypothetical protein